MVENIKTALYFITMLSVLVIAHEWGHFIVAKMCGMRVDDFSLFFGKRLLRLGVRNGTEYNIRSIPLGGFVKIAGMEPDDISNGHPVFQTLNRDDQIKTKREFFKSLQGFTEDQLAGINAENVSARVITSVEEAIGDNSRLTAEGKLQLRSLLEGTALNEDEHKYLEAILAADTYVPDPHGYNQKPLWQRAAVIFAGPFMSLFFGYLIVCVMGFTGGLPDPDHIGVKLVTPGSVAEKAGLRGGDEIVSINGKPIADFETVVKIIGDSPGKPIMMVIMRNGQQQSITATPKAETVDWKEPNGKTIKKAVGRIGFAPDVVWKRYSVGESIQRSSSLLVNSLKMTAQTIFSKKAGDSVGGPVAIVGMVHQASQIGYKYIILMAAELSISLGIMNLLPIPILDGGHLLLLGIEGIRGRKLSSREMNFAQMFGLSIIGILFVVVMTHDLWRLFSHHS